MAGGIHGRETAARAVSATHDGGEGLGAVCAKVSIGSLESEEATLEADGERDDGSLFSS